MELLQNKLYIEDIKRVSESQLPWEKLEGKTILISGASGMIGSFLIDVLMYKNKEIFGLDGVGPDLSEQRS